MDKNVKRLWVWWKKGAVLVTAVFILNVIVTLVYSTFGLKNMILRGIILGLLITPLWGWIVEIINKSIKN